MLRLWTWKAEGSGQKHSAAPQNRSFVFIVVLQFYLSLFLLVEILSVEESCFYIEILKPEGIVKANQHWAF